ncbi:hypothetical protein KSP39_PZI022812 [Platanthera zijinensis]|uniref:Uncharacterized protein n=1 Tax=Platanthera zijinensis TaxID=2320716 RepID=A0AAP0FU82_9ASPA
MMERGIVFAAASLAAAFSVKLASRSDNHVAPYRSFDEGSDMTRKGDGSGLRKGAEKMFVPKFDGMRFIETLVTAHR